MPKKPQAIPPISNQQMEWVISESELTQAQLQKMIRELYANPFNFESVELAQALCSAARSGFPHLGPDGQAFVDLVKSWEPWLWEENKE